MFTIVWESITVVSIFSEISQSVWLKFDSLPQPVDLLKLILNLFRTSNSQGRERCWCDFMTYTFNSVMCQDTCEPICFKLGMIQNTLYSTLLFQFEWPSCSLTNMDHLEHLLFLFVWSFYERRAHIFKVSTRYGHAAERNNAETVPKQE